MRPLKTGRVKRSRHACPLRRAHPINPLTRNGTIHQQRATFSGQGCAELVASSRSANLVYPTKVVKTMVIIRPPLVAAAAKPGDLNDLRTLLLARDSGPR